MTQGEFDNLRIGDIIRGRSSGDSYVVVDLYGDHAIAVRVVTVTNPIEWERVHTLIVAPPVGKKIIFACSTCGRPLLEDDICYCNECGRPFLAHEGTGGTCKICRSPYHGRTEFQRSSSA